FQHFMEILQVTKVRMLQISKKFTLLFVVIFIAFSIVLTMHSKSSFSLFEVFTKDKMQQLVGQNKNAHNITNVTTNGGPVQNTSSHHNFKGAYNNVENNTASKSDQYFLPSLFMTPFFNTELEKMFVEKDTVFHHLGRYLFHPSNSAWRLITKIYQKHLAKADEKIGIQIRVYNPVTTPQQVIANLVLNCTLENNLLPKVLDMKSSISSKTTTKVVLVASLNPQYGENLKTMYMNKSTVSGEVIEIFQPSHEDQQKFNDNEHNMKAWVDMYLLSLSDVLVTTSLSTFGYVAQGLGNLRPWLLYKLVNNETHYPACEREFSMEPCYHSPPKHYCSGKPIMEFSSSFLYMRKCKDFGFGVKLVS
ncbi:hypothetical protein KIW84_073411, partial [Lathyrus oleraceus]